MCTEYFIVVYLLLLKLIAVAQGEGSIPPNVSFLYSVYMHVCSVLLRSQLIYFVVRISPNRQCVHNYNNVCIL